MQRVPWKSGPLPLCRPQPATFRNHPSLLHLRRPVAVTGTSEDFFSFFFSPRFRQFLYYRTHSVLHHPSLLYLRIWLSQALSLSLSLSLCVCVCVCPCPPPSHPPSLPPPPLPPISPPKPQSPFPQPQTLKPQKHTNKQSGGRLRGSDTLQGWKRTYRIDDCLLSSPYRHVSHGCGGPGFLW